MKKVLSLILTIAMVMSLFCAVPVSATEGENITPEYTFAELPYFFCDFENNRTALPGGTTIVEDNERGDVARLSTTDQGPKDVEVASSAYTNCHVGYELKAGDYVTASFWLKLSKPLKQGAAIRVLMWDHAEGATTQQSVIAYIPDYTSTDWQYVTGMISLSSDFTFEKMNFRPGVSTNNQAADDSDAVDYYIDDLEIKIEKGTYQKSWADGVPTGGYNYYQADGLQIGTATIEGPSGLDVTVRQYQSKEEYVTTGKACQVYNNGAGGQKASIGIGDEVRVTMWIHNDKDFASQSYYALKVGAKSFQFAIPGLEAGWHRIDQTIINDTDVTDGQLYHAFGCPNYDLRNATKATDGTYPVLSVFDYRIFFKRPAKATVSTHTTFSHSGGAYIALMEKATTKNGYSGEGVATVTGPPGADEKVSVYQFNGTVDQFNHIHGGTGEKITFTTGDILKVSMWIKLSTPTTAEKAYYVLAPASDTAHQYPVAFDGKSTEWQKLDATFEIKGDSENVCYHGFSSLTTFNGVNTRNTLVCEDGTYPDIYVDDWKISFATPSESATLIPVADVSYAAMTNDGLDVDYTITSKAGTELENATLVYKIVGAESGKVYATAYPRDSVSAVKTDEELLLEVVPTANGFVGETVAVELLDLSTDVEEPDVEEPNGDRPEAGGSGGGGEVSYTTAKLPYFFCDFEGNRTALPGATIETDNERGDVARLSTVDPGPNDVEIASSAYTNCHIGYELAAGDYVTVSFWLKLSTPLKQGAAIRVLMWDKAEGASAQKSVIAYVPDYTSTDWQYVSAHAGMSSAFTFEKMNFRLGVNTNNQAADESYAVDYYIDDLEIKIEKGTYQRSWEDGVPTGSYNYYQADGLQIGTATIEGPSGHDVTVRQYQSKEEYVTTGKACQVYYNYAGNQVATIDAGDEVRVTMWIHNDKDFASQSYYALKVGGKTFQFAIPGLEAGWHRIDQTIVNDTAVENGPLYHAFGCPNYDLRNATKATDGTYPVLSVFDYRIYFKRPDRGLVSPHTSYKHSGSGSAALWNNGMLITGSTGITAEQHDGTEGKVSEIKADPNAAQDKKHNHMFNANWGGAVFNHTAGDVIKVSAWVKLPEPAAADTVYYTVFNLTESIVLPIDGKSTEWQYIEGSMVASKDHANIYYQGYTTVDAGSYTGTNTSYWPKDDDGENISIYVDDWNISVSTPSESATLFPVVDVSFAEMTDSGLDVDCTITSKIGVAIENATAVFKIVGAKSGRVYSSGYSLDSISAVSANEKLLLEVVPVANGFVGLPVKVEIEGIDIIDFNGIQILDGDATFALISTEAILKDTTVIWVGYNDESGYAKMTGVSTATVNADAYSSFEVSNTKDLGDFTYVKIFLWKNISKSSVPAAEYYVY